MQKKIKSSELLSFLIVEIGGKKKNKVGTVQLYFLFNPKTAKNENCTSLGSSNSISQLPVRDVIRILAIVYVWMWDNIKWIFKLLQDKVQMCIVRMSAIYIKSNVMSQSLRWVFLVKRLDKKCIVFPFLIFQNQKTT